MKKTNQNHLIPYWRLSMRSQNRQKTKEADTTEGTGPRDAVGISHADSCPEHIEWGLLGTLWTYVVWSIRNFNLI